MLSLRACRPIFLTAILCVGLHAAESLPAVTEPVAVDEEPLPLMHNRSVLPVLGDPLARTVRSVRPRPGCKVAPLTEITDDEALEAEKNADFSEAEPEGLAPETAASLDSFREMVTSLGGTFLLRSAYRAPAYQAHLHEVWVKWMKQLRGNRTAACQALREDVGAEFRRHQLLPRQQPAPASDHALGLAFDARVAVPRGARVNRKPVTVDKVAALTGLRRPNRGRDPVHFTLLARRVATGD